MTDPHVLDISPQQTAALAASGDVLLLDVRGPDELAAGHAEGAVHMPLGQLDPAAVPNDRPVVAMCRSGNRSGIAAVLLAGAGRAVSNMAGGMQAWAEAGLPTVTDDGSPGVLG
jgi:rhodanese-related sulfurtransferase